MGRFGSAVCNTPGRCWVLRAPSAEHESQLQKSQRPVSEIIKQPVFLVAVLGGIAGYGLMTLVMTATPLSMHIKDGYSVEATANVIRKDQLLRGRQILTPAEAANHE